MITSVNDLSPILSAIDNIYEYFKHGYHVYEYTAGICYSESNYLLIWPSIYACDNNLKLISWFYHHIM